MVTLEAEDDSYWIVECRRLRALGDYIEALDAIDRALAEESSVVAWVEKGHTLFDYQRFDDAVVAYDAALFLDPDDWCLWNDKGAALYANARFGDAISAFETALQLNSRDAAVYGNLGAALLKTKQPARALAAFEREATLDPEQVLLWTDMALTLTVLGRPEEALVALQRAQTLDPAATDIYLKMGRLLLDLGRLDACLHALESALAIDPRNAIAWQQKGKVLVRLQRFKEAVATFEAALALTVESADQAPVWRDLGDALQHLGRELEALHAFMQAYRIAPHDPVATRNFAALLLKTGAAADASVVWGEYLRRNPTDSSAWCGLARAHCMLRHWEAGCDAADHALRLDPNLTEASLLRAWTLVRLGHPRAALATYARAYIHAYIQRYGPASDHG